MLRLRTWARKLVYRAGICVSVAGIYSMSSDCIFWFLLRYRCSSLFSGKFSIQSCVPNISVSFLSSGSRIKLRFTSCTFLPYLVDVPMAEAFALKEGLLLAQHAGCNRLIVQSDCMEVVKTMATEDSRQIQVLLCMMSVILFGAGFRWSPSNIAAERQTRRCTSWLGEAWSQNSIVFGRWTPLVLFLSLRWTM